MNQEDNETTHVASGTSTTSDPTLRRLKDKQKEYKRQSTIWQIVHFLLGGLSVTLAAVIANEASLPAGTTTEGVATVLAISAALSTFLRPDARAKKFNAARQVLRRARTVYEHEDHPLVKALNEADELVLQE